MKIWQKHIVKKLLKTFAFFLFCLFFIYVVIDLSAHGVRFFSKSSFVEIIYFYLNTFASLLDLFLTLTFLLASMRVLFDLNSHRELVALHMAGISKKRILVPFFAIAACLSLVSYINSQCFATNAGEITANFKIAHKSKEKQTTPREKLFTISLEDESEIIYHRFNKEKKELQDVFWVCAPDDIWHMKTLHIDTMDAEYVNHLTRNQAKQFEKTKSFARRHFEEIPWDHNTILNRFINYECRSISTLFLQALSAPADSRVILSHLYYKLLAPLIPFFALVAIAPFALNYTRNRQTFLLTVLFIFSFIALKIIMDGMLILGENQVLPASVAIFTPIALLLTFSLPPFLRLR
jgi:lipopolysaccharide export LptBFGC system permease protein LptF